jgi:antitoxin CptB
MTATGPNPGFDQRRRRLRYRMWHRGTREMDLIMGRFADAEMAEMSESEIAELERLADMPDPDLYDWIVGEGSVPPDCDGAVLRRLRDFNASKAGK